MSGLVQNSIGLRGLPLVSKLLNTRGQSAFDRRSVLGFEDR